MTDESSSVREVPIWKETSGFYTDFVKKSKTLLYEGRETL